jgi:two-component system chemotaxis response regulator CheY
MHILVVDDSGGMRRILASTLSRLGFSDISEAGDAAAALTELRRRAVDLAIIDWNMPGGTGLDLARAIRADTATRDVPLLMVTGNSGAEDVVLALRSGFGGYIVKPFSEDTLAHQLGALLHIETPTRRAAVPMIPANWSDWLAGGAWTHHALKAIPAAPRNFNDVFSIAGENDVDARRLIALVSSDPIFTIRVLRLANVAAFAAAGDVTSLEIAVVRLGTRAVRNALLASCLSSWAQTVDVYGRRGGIEVQHAVGTACLGRRIGERLQMDADEAFVYGLLHDVGKMCLLKMRSDFRRLGGRAPSEDEFDVTCREHHAAVGAAALQVWGLPEPVRAATRWHHQPDAAEGHQQAAAISYLANRLSHRYGFGCPPDDEREGLLADPLCLALGLDAEWLDRLDQQALDIGIAAQQLVS